MKKISILFFLLINILYSDIKNISQASGEEIFQSRCSACHGNKAHIYALGYSEIISGWSTRKLSFILRSYKDGIYGGSMSEVMQEQVADLNDHQIDELAIYINSLSN